MTTLAALEKLQDDGLDPTTPAYHAASVLPGHPDMMDKMRRLEMVAEGNRNDTAGNGHIAWMEKCKKYGKQGASSNIVIPAVGAHASATALKRRTHSLCYACLQVVPPVRGKEKMPRISNIVLVVHPDDAERLSHEHVQKNSRFNLAFGDSIIGTMDNKEWRRQRSAMNPAMDVRLTNILCSPRDAMLMSQRYRSLEPWPTSSHCRWRFLRSTLPSSAQWPERWSTSTNT